MKFSFKKNYLSELLGTWKFSFDRYRFGTIYDDLGTIYDDLTTDRMYRGCWG